MANYKQHYTGAAVAGVVGSCAVVAVGELDPVMLPIAVLNGWAGGMLPDIDSPTSKVNRTAFLSSAVGVPIVFLFSFPDLPGRWTIAAAMPGLIWFVLRGVFNKLTAHRGITHSIPAMAIYGYGVALVSGVPAVGFVGGLGWLTHLILDEVYSRNTAAKGTALRLWSKSIPTSIAAYVVLGLVLTAFYSSSSFNSLILYCMSLITVLR